MKKPDLRCNNVVEMEHISRVRTILEKARRRTADGGIPEDMLDSCAARIVSALASDAECNNVTLPSFTHSELMLLEQAFHLLMCRITMSAAVDSAEAVIQALRVKVYGQFSKEVSRD